MCDIDELVVKNCFILCLVDVDEFQSNYSFYKNKRQLYVVNYPAYPLYNEFAIQDEFSCKANGATSEAVSLNCKYMFSTAILRRHLPYHKHIPKTSKTYLQDIYFYAII